MGRPEPWHLGAGTTLQVRVSIPARGAERNAWRPRRGGTRRHDAL